MYDLQEKVVLITGAANGIGAAFVRLALNEGAKHVRVLDVDETAGNSLQNEENVKHGSGKLKFIKCDVSNHADLFKAFKDTIDEYGYIDLVYNNAAVATEASAESIQKEVEINVTAMMNSSIKAIELMRKDKGGKGGTIINISSVAAILRMSPTLFVYSGTKSAVLQFSNCIGKEPYYSKTGVRVVTICYGLTETSILEKMTSYDEDVMENLQNILKTFPRQTPEMAAIRTLEAFRQGESGSTWIVNNNKPAKDVTAILNKASEEIEKLIFD